MFNDEDKLKFRKYCQEIISKPRFINLQKHHLSGTHIFCEDWEIVEMLKYMFHGKDLYLGDPPPVRLRNNPLWSKNNIIEKADALTAQYLTADNIINHFRGMRSREHGE